MLLYQYHIWLLFSVRVRMTQRRVGPQKSSLLTRCYNREAVLYGTLLYGPYMQGISIASVCTIDIVYLRSLSLCSILILYHYPLNVFGSLLSCASPRSAAPPCSSTQQGTPTLIRILFIVQSHSSTRYLGIRIHFNFEIQVRVQIKSMHVEQH